MKPESSCRESSDGGLEICEEQAVAARLAGEQTARHLHLFVHV